MTRDGEHAILAHVTSADDAVGVERATRDAAVALSTAIESLERLDADSLREPSALPGWTRGHVLSHLAGAAGAAARQAEAAARGEVVPLYEGGRERRDAEIEAGARRSVEEHAETLARAGERLEEAWPEPGSPLWQAPTAYHDSPLHEVALLWWREVRIHLVDLQAGVGPGSWDDDLCRHLLGFLAPRLDEAGRVELVATDTGLEWSVGHGEPGVPLVVRGCLRDVVAWLAGRIPEGRVTAARRGEEAALPGLGPWPSVSSTPRPH